MDTALRNRLTGAALLILLAVILLPEMLTGEGGARTAPTGTAGGVDQPVQTYDFDLSEQTEAPPPAVEAPAPTPAPTPEPTAVPPQPVVATTTPPPKPAAASETGYFVQIGVFSNQASANRLATELRKKKFAVVVTKIDEAKPLHRVRVGPEADRKAAEALAKRLASAGHKGSVVSAP